MNESRTRLPLLALAALALLAALWAALVRLGWPLPALPLPIAGQHGALMTSGFLGTLIGVERAVALRWRPAYAGPLLSGLGTLALGLGASLDLGRGLVALGALGLVIVFGRIIRASGPPGGHAGVHIWIMALGAVVWLVGDLMWWWRWSMLAVVPWWIGFLVLTIAGERLELGRILRPGRAARLWFNLSVGAFLAGLAASFWRLDLGWRLAGLGLIALGAWLLWNDIARHAVRRFGLTRYIAACLLPGYIWLIVGGVLWTALGDRLGENLIYDAALHTVLLGFVFSMIFGHGPIILPAVLGREFRHSPGLYIPLVLLHLSLVVRVLGDLAGRADVRQWGGLFNVVAVLIFLPMMAVLTQRWVVSATAPVR